MGSLLYLAWRLYNGRYDNFPYDWPILCLLLSLDCQTLLRWFIWRRGN